MLANLRIIQYSPKIMPKKKRSLFKNLGWGLLGDAFLLTTAIVITAVFAVSSFSVAYTIAFAVLILLLSALYIVNRVRKRDKLK